MRLTILYHLKKFNLIGKALKLEDRSRSWTEKEGEKVKRRKGEEEVKGSI